MYDDKKRTLSYARCRKRQLSLSVILCLIGGAVGVPLAILLSVGIVKLCENIISESRAFMIVLFIFFVIVVFAAVLFCLSPLVYGIYKVIKVLRYYEIVVDKVEYVKPFEKRSKVQQRHRTEPLYLHGIYFKQYGTYLTEDNFEKYHIWEKYYLEICGKNKIKIIDAYSCNQYELER